MFFKKIIKGIMAIALSVLTVMAGFISSATTVYSAYAESTQAINFDETDITDDLQDVDVLLYPKNPYGKHEVIRFMEYCFSTRPFLAEQYGLYLYVYNPTEKVVSSSGNVANMAVSYGEDGEPSGYSNIALTLLDKTSNNRFLKFKVTNSTMFLTIAKAYAETHNNERRYDVASIQLYYTDGTNAKDETVSKTYRWTGFAAGCGTEYDSEPTLAVEPLETLTLDVHPTYYRPEGSNGKNEYMQDTLHSVYFSVPNDMIEKYGELYAVHATYLSAMLKPMLLTGNQDAYNAILPYLGVDTNALTVNDFNYQYVVNSYFENNAVTAFKGDYFYGTQDFVDYVEDLVIDIFDVKNIIEAFYLMFTPDSFGENSADTYIVSSKEIKRQMELSAEKFGGELVQGSESLYSKAIFENVDEMYTDIELTADDETKELTSEIISQNFWDKIFGGSHVESTKTFDNIQAVYAVKDTDITGSKAGDCANLYISAGDYDEFVETYNTAKKQDETLYLFRYRTSEYFAAEADLWGENGKIMGMSMSWGFIDSNARIFQQSVDLDFDVIDVTFRNDEGDTVIGVVADPLDIVHDSTPALNTTTDKPPINWFQILLFVIGGLLLIFYGPKLLVAVVQGVFDILVGIFSGGRRK